MPRDPEKRAEYLKKYREANKEKKAEYLKKYREANKEKIAKYSKKYREANKEKIAELIKSYSKEKIAAYGKKYREANKEKIAERRKKNHKGYCEKYYQANKEKIAEREKKYREANPELTARKSLKRQNRLKIATPENPEDRAIIREIYKLRTRINKCMGIPNLMHVDHIIPVSKGGFHAPGNLQILPAKLNIRKYNKLISVSTNF
jgi:hypothetical protein